jgi:hypothetical protein
MTAWGQNSVIRRCPSIYEYTPLPPRSATASIVLCPLFAVCPHMDREKLRRQLDEAEENVAQSVQHVAEQWNLIARLEGKGQDTATPRRLLALLEESRDFHIVERDHLLRVLREYFPEVPTVVGPPSPENGTPA